MRQIPILLVALGIISLPALNAQAAQSQGKSHYIITQDLYDQVKIKTSQWKAHKPEDNPLSKYSDDELIGLLGLINDPEYLAAKEDKEKSSKKTEQILSATVIPTSFDSRTQWPGCVGYVRNQGNCGACWAFGAAEVLGDRFCIASNGTINVPLSPQFLVSCEKDQYACQGGVLSYVWSYLANAGSTVSEACSPYTSGQYGQVPFCPVKCKDGTALKKYKCLAGTVVTKTTIESIQEEILANGPMETGFSVYQDFLSYRTGIYKHVYGAFAGGHAVKIIGWGELNGIKYWIAQNSWGTSWGESGYFRIQFGEGGFDSYVMACTPNLTVV